MLEEFRRRKNLQSWSEKLKTKGVLEHDEDFENDPAWDGDEDDEDADTDDPIGKYMAPERGEIFNTEDFNLCFMDSDSVTNVTRLNRVNSRRILVWIGNMRGVIGYAMGKGLDYEEAFERCFMKLKRNLIALDIDQMNTNPIHMTGKHNDF